MTTNYGGPELTRRKALASMSAIPMGLMAMPAAAHQLMDSFLAEAAIDKSTTSRSIETEPFLVTF